MAWFTIAECRALRYWALNELETTNPFIEKEEIQNPSIVSVNTALSVKKQNSEIESNPKRKSKLKRKVTKKSATHHMKLRNRVQILRYNSDNLMRKTKELPHRTGSREGSHFRRRSQKEIKKEVKRKLIGHIFLTSRYRLSKFLEDSDCFCGSEDRPWLIGDVAVAWVDMDLRVHEK